jgi:hypothetical protein
MVRLKTPNDLEIALRQNGGEPVALAGGDELLHGLAVCGKTGREDPSIPRARHQSRTGRGDGAVPG